MSSTSLVDSTREILIPMGGLKIGQGKNILKTFVGSCVALCIFDAEKKIAGMSHIMLPKNVKGQLTKGTTQEGKYADEAIDNIIEKLSKISSDLKLEAKMAGGANIFEHESDLGSIHIGSKNIIGIRLLLEEKKIPIISRAVGLKNGRWVSFECINQRLRVRDKNGEKII